MHLSVDHISLLFVAAWFIQMGAHEGAHAFVADWCGDDTARLQGKRSFNPFAHVDWGSIQSVLFAVVCPIITAFSGLVPMGMAWVPVTATRLKGWRRDLALVSFAGPLANFVVACACLPIHAGILSIGYAEQSLLRIFDDLCWAVYLTSIVYGLFNLIPLPPLDGAKVLHYFLPAAGRDVMDRLAPYGMFILIALFFFGPANGILDLPLGLAKLAWYAVGS